MRRLNRKKAFKVVKELDAFPKVPDSYQVKSNSGATGKKAQRAKRFVHRVDVVGL